MRKLRSRSPQRSSSPTPTVANSDVMADLENEVIELQDVEKDKEKETDAGGDEENGGEDSNDSDEEDSSSDAEAAERIFYSEEERNTLKRCFSDMMAVAERQGGVHPKMAGVLDKVFKGVKKVGGDIGKNKRRRICQRTWKDSNSNTMYLD